MSNAISSLLIFIKFYFEINAGQILLVWGFEKLLVTCFETNWWSFRRRSPISSGLKSCVLFLQLLLQENCPFFLFLLIKLVWFDLFCQVCLQLYVVRILLTKLWWLWFNIRADKPCVIWAKRFCQVIRIQLKVNTCLSFKSFLNRKVGKSSDWVFLRFQKCWNFCCVVFISESLGRDWSQKHTVIINLTLFGNLSF